MAAKWWIGGSGRWKDQGIRLRPWREDGEHILLLPQRGFGASFCRSASSVGRKYGGMAQSSYISRDSSTAASWKFAGAETASQRSAGLLGHRLLGQRRWSQKHRCWHSMLFRLGKMGRVSAAFHLIKSASMIRRTFGKARPYRQTRLAKRCLIGFRGCNGRPLKSPKERRSNGFSRFTWNAEKPPETSLCCALLSLTLLRFAVPSSAESVN